MTSPKVSRQFTKLFHFHNQGIFSEQEFRLRLTNLVAEEDLSELLDTFPPESLPWIKDAMESAAQNALDEDRLSPERSPFDDPSHVGMELSFARQLLIEVEAFRHAILNGVCLPSFQPPWSVRVGGSINKGFIAITTELAEHPPYHHITDTSVRASQRTINPHLVEQLCEIWKSVLLRTRHPNQQRIGLDGVSYHFCYSGAGVGRMAGRTWSPERTTVPGKLAALLHALRAFIEADDQHLDQAHQEVINRMAEFEK